MMKNEYIIPITSTTRKIRLYPDESKRLGPWVGLRTCLKPGFRLSTPCFITTNEEHQEAEPREIPLELLKTKALGMLTEAVQCSGSHPDPVGGSVEFQFVPVLKLIEPCWSVGVFDDDDCLQILLSSIPLCLGSTVGEI